MVRLIGNWHAPLAADRVGVIRKLKFGVSLLKVDGDFVIDTTVSCRQPRIAAAISPNRL